MCTQLRTFLLSGVAAVAMLHTTGVFAQQAATVDCSVDGAQYTCSHATLLRTFAEGRTIAVESQPKDRVSEGQLASFATSLGKQIVPETGAAITLRLVRDQPTGFSVGPGDSELATLRVFAGSGPNSHLIWVERYRGQSDRPWPSVVHSITSQFQATLAGR